MRAAPLILLALPSMLAAWPAPAQTPSSAEQLIQALTPRDALSGTTDGIRLGTPFMRAPPAVSLTVEFGTGSAELSPQARATLDELGRALVSRDLAQYRFRIEGHTDTVGTRAANQALSQRRAESVAAYLQRRFGIAPSRLEAIGLGEDELAVATPPQTPNARNRRVKVVNLGA